MNETKFTERAQTALRLAQEAACELGHGYVGSEHLLLGLSREGRGVAAKVLRGAGLEPESIRAAIVRMVGSGAPGERPSQGLTPRCKKIIELSLSEAARLGHHYVGTEHQTVSQLPISLRTEPHLHPTARGLICGHPILPSSANPTA